MHYHCEVIMPPTDDPERVVEQVLAPFYEGDSENYGSFWDFYVIGGRFSGMKAQAHLDPERVQLFVAELKKRNVTVSGVQFGKQELQPAAQIEMVDGLWREWFPRSGLDQCPIFQHSGERLPGDICTIADAPLDMKAARVIVAGPHWEDASRREAVWMVEDSYWNGVNHVDTDWDRTIRGALKLYWKYMDNRPEAYSAPRTVRGEWLTVTVDYHS